MWYVSPARDPLELNVRRNSRISILSRSLLVIRLVPACSTLGHLASRGSSSGQFSLSQMDLMIPFLCCYFW